MNRNIGALLLLLSFAVMASAEPVDVSVSAQNPLVCQPVYLSMQTTSEYKADFSFGALGSHASDLILMIKGPTGDPAPYRSPLQMEVLAEPGAKQLPLRTTECLILHRGAILTDKPGLYDFWLVDRRDPNRRLSNMASVTVRDVSTTSDSAAVQKIRSCPAQYATFVYLKGGDHLKKAFQVMAALAEGTSSYRALARTLLAVTYCQTIYTDPANAVYRDKDPVKVDQYFPTTADPSVSAELRTSLASLARKRFTGVDVPPTLAAKIEQTLAETR